MLDRCRDRGLHAGDRRVVHGRPDRRPADRGARARRTSIAGGIVSYSNEVKIEQLGVPPELIEEHGAVSAEVAEAMARGARERLGVDVAVSVTGIAGPGGGTEEKPVGLVYFHAETPDGGHGSHFSFPGDRDSIRRRSVVAVAAPRAATVGTES